MEEENIHDAGINPSSDAPEEDADTTQGGGIEYGSAEAAEDGETAKNADFDGEVIKSQRSGDTYSERMRKAGYVVGKQYDALKNAFLSYHIEKGNKSVKPRVSRDGETFIAGRSAIGKICIVGGYLRLFLALDPNSYSKEKYHHKDYSEVSRYASYPLMIKISSARSLKYALELIAEAVQQRGYTPNEGYASADQAHIFYTGARKKPVARPSAAAATQSEASEEEPQEEPFIQEQPQEEQPAEEIQEASQQEEPVEEMQEEPAHEEVQTEPDPQPVFPQNAKGARLPHRARVVNRRGEKIGKVRKSVWYDAGENEKGDFRKEEKEVFLYRGEERCGYVDCNDNVFTLSNDYVATVKTVRWWLILLVVFAFAAIVVISSCFAAFYLRRSEGLDYAPTLFIADQDGTEWSLSENLPVFYNERFGDSKIAPGQKGTYAFKFENRNADPLIYNLTFSSENPHGIGLTYRLKRDGAYISGIADYVPAESLSCTDLTVESGSATVFVLEWYWRENDEVDTNAGKNEAQYTLFIGLQASASIRQ